MNGVESVMSAEGLHTIFAENRSQNVSGALAASRKQLGNALGGSGFVYVTGQLSENFETYLDRKPFEVQVGNLKPGTLPEIITWVAGKLSAEPDQAEQAQARVPPEKAVKLLT